MSTFKHGYDSGDSMYIEAELDYDFIPGYEDSYTNDPRDPKFWVPCEVIINRACVTLVVYCDVDGKESCRVTRDNMSAEAKKHYDDLVYADCVDDEGLLEDITEAQE